MLPQACAGLFAVAISAKAMLTTWLVELLLIPQSDGLEPMFVD